MGTHTTDWSMCSRSRCYGQYQSRPLDLSSKTWRFLPKQTAKKFGWSSWGWEVQIRNCQSFPSLQMNQSSHLILASPTWHISLCLGLVPEEMSTGLAGWQEQAVLSISTFKTSQWSLGLKEKNPSLPDPPEEQRLAGQLRIPKSHSPMLGRVCSWTVCAFRSESPHWMAKGHKTNRHIDSEGVMVQKASWWGTLCFDLHHCLPGY